MVLSANWVTAHEHIQYVCTNTEDANLVMIQGADQETTRNTKMSNIVAHRSD